MRTRRDKRIENEIAALAALQDDEIDTSDIPEVKDWNAAIRGRFDRRKNKHVIVRLHDTGSKRLRASLVAWKESLSREARASFRGWLDDFSDIRAQLPPKPEPQPASSRSMRYGRMANPERKTESSAKKEAGSHPFDADYLQRLKAQDPATEAHFVAYFSPRLEMKLRDRGLAASMIEDVSQEAFYRVLTAVRGGAVLFTEKFVAYVNGVCNRIILERYREFARNQHLDLAMDLPDGMTNVEALILRKEQMAIVAEILNQLPAKERNILRALIYEQLSEDEMCERFGVKRDSLRVTLSRAKKEFVARARTFIGEMGPRSAALGGAKGKGIAGTRGEKGEKGTA